MLSLEIVSRCDFILINIICIFQQYPYDIPTEAFSFEIFKQAFVAVQSCVVHLQVGFNLLGLFLSLL